jgi:eukaryotic-like serine/threonine-protein kinase
MTPERWQQVTEALDKLRHFSATQRLDYLAEVARGDPELHRELESLLASHEEAGAEFLNAPASPTAPGEVEADPQHTLLGRRLGAYQIVELIGIGGMGKVYRAFRADDQYRKQVALKVVRGGPGLRFRNQPVQERTADSRQPRSSEHCAAP